jgi:RimJ/RimL family protein N-acetyltransferase
VGHLADTYGITELWAAVHPDNAASIRLLGRAGFTETAVLSRPVGSYDDGDLVFARLAPTG